MTQKTQSIVFRRSRAIHVGQIIIGGEAPIVIQSMTTTRARDVEASVEAVLRLHAAGSQLVRVTAPTVEDASAFEEIVRKVRVQYGEVPIVADIHYSPKAAEEASHWVNKIRINPGNYSSWRPAENDADYNELLAEMRERLRPLFSLCKERNVAIRIGVNHGSLAPRIVKRWGDGVRGMVEEALEVLTLCEELHFHDVVISLKASDVPSMVQANRIFRYEMEKRGWCYPLHLGVTEAGDAMQGIIKSAIGIGTLLLDGIGDTIRVSLTGEPEKEIGVCKAIIGVVNEMQQAGYEAIAQASPTYNSLNTQRFILGVICPPHFTEYHLQKMGCFLNEKNEYACSATSPNLFLISSTLPIEQAMSIRVAENTKQRIYYITDTHSLPQGVELFTCCAHTNTPSYVLRCALSHLDEGVAYCEQLDSTLNALSFLIIYSDECNPRKIWKAAHAVRSVIPSLTILYENYSIGQYTQELERQVAHAIAYGGGILCGAIDGLIMNLENEDITQSITLGQYILQSCGGTRVHTEYISCPSCGRTLFNIEERLQEIKAATRTQRHLRIGVMGCIVNGPGEMKGADYGYVGAGVGKITLYRGKTPVRKNIPEAEAVQALVALIKADGRWHEEQ